jgi:hypothetical protein
VSGRTGLEVISIWRLAVNAQMERLGGHVESRVGYPSSGLRSILAVTKGDAMRREGLYKLEDVLEHPIRHLHHSDDGTRDRGGR